MKKLKDKIIWSDILSFIFGFFGIMFGSLSAISLEPFWNPNEKVRDTHSFIFTLLSIFFDSLSVLSAFGAYRSGTKLYNLQKTTMQNTQSLGHQYERWAFRCDLLSFIFGIGGLIFGAVSLITLFPLTFNEYVSWWGTITSVCFDTISCFLVVCALCFFRQSIKLPN
ncbi:hypothetical protein [Spiroplasma eriocheiris]|uniref:Uncharacterized protein n=1 Tax=Spiroplasma eriocheiris TaxID=315358 RepID=A0A0H3XJR3_9MOLU|nr:hypothetical protein [Spiroplasma eriocheiris]AHF57653.1 putative transmembrane protein [Spiroplasma eriocheiris CCTCC M 207170]AKM54106.1 hypothetical protein SERIO_v1c05320 [Spiroplasma eriocheiris]